MRYRLRLICLLCVAMVFTGCEDQKPSSQWLFYLTAPTNILFSPEQATASYEGIMLNLSNGEQKKVGQVTGNDCLEWSAVNQQFLRVVEDQIHLYDQNLREVATPTVKDMVISSAAWVPDGKRIVFSGETRDAPYGRVNLFVMDKDGANIRKLAFDENKYSRSCCAAVSPDGKQIVFVSSRDYDKKPGNELDYDIFLTSFNGTGVDRLASNSPTIPTHFLEGHNGHQMGKRLFIPIGVWI